MPEYIERAAAAKIICAWCGTCSNPTVEDLLKCDDICPEFAQIPAYVQPVKRGKWTLNKDGSGTCSECGFVQNSCWDLDNWDNFCHHCGADMREEGVPHG